MKELFSAFSSAVFFPLVSLVLPGLTAISSWYVLIMRSVFGNWSRRTIPRLRLFLCCSPSLLEPSLTIWE
jgi:hypothetical protein